MLAKLLYFIDASQIRIYWPLYEVNQESPANLLIARLQPSLFRCGIAVQVTTGSCKQMCTMAPTYRTFAEVSSTCSEQSYCLLQDIYKHEPQTGCAFCPRGCSLVSGDQRLQTAEW